MHLEWNKVTWYSKLLAVVLFISTFFLGFYFGWTYGLGSALKVTILDYDNGTNNESGIQGSVILGPTCPVMKNPPDEACADKPFATPLVITTLDGAKTIKEFKSDANGTFRVQVSPGDYSIRSSAAGNIHPYCSSRESIKVSDNSYTETTIYCDTGIR